MLSRYERIDDYTREELRREYVASDSRGRIRLLQEGLERGPLDHFLDIAVRDEHADVRRWVARHAPLTPQGRDVIAADADPFVRASLHENSFAFSESDADPSWRQRFSEATHLERLALVRNESLPVDVIERLFDPSGTELGIPDTERQGLAIAALSNADVFERLTRDAWLDPEVPIPVDYDANRQAERCLRCIWDNAQAWPEESGVRFLIYRHVPMHDDVKAEWYKASPPSLRGAILLNCASQDRMTLEIGTSDPEEQNRSRAYARISELLHDDLTALLRSDDARVLDAACRNDLIRPDYRKQLLDRLRELGYDDPSTDALGDEIDQALQQWPASAEPVKEEDPTEAFERLANELRQHVSETGIKTARDLTQHLTETLQMRTRESAADRALLEQSVCETRAVLQSVEAQTATVGTTLERVSAYSMAIPDLILLSLACVGVTDVVLRGVTLGPALVGVFLMAALARHVSQRTITDSERRSRRYVAKS